MKQDLIIFGSAETAELAAFYFEEEGEWRVIAHVVDDDYWEDKQINGKPLIKLSQLDNYCSKDNVKVFVAISYQKINKLRTAKYKQLKEMGYRFATFVSKHAYVASNVIIGENCMILEGQTIQKDVVIGNNVIIWSSNHIGHGSIINDNCYLASQICLSGHCVINESVFIGVGVTIKDFVSIGRDSFLGMSTIITDNIADGSVVVEKQSQVYGHDDKIARVLKRRYFGV